MSVMKFRRFLICKAFLTMLVSSFLWLCMYPDYALAGTVNVPAGTSVTLQFAENVSPETKRVGDSVYLTVVNDVIVDGKVVIKAGARAFGEVVKSKERNYLGIPAEIGVVVKSVKAVDGTQIMLGGTTKMQEGADKMVVTIALTVLICVLFALRKGGDAFISQGTQVMAMTAVNVQIQVP